ncbi:MAG TPA: hypothetical protein VJ721_09225, partial [Chthoniobacterales bacterium]|nr:hypothetical protein [Chthoniobacterales bacterium]
VTRVTVRATEVREFDWAKQRARARIAYVSSGPKTLDSRMIDNDLQTSFQFSESDKSPMVIVQLAKSAQLHRVSTVFKAEDARLDVIMLDALPKNLADLQSAKPDVSAVNLPDERGLVTANVAVSSARYVVFRWKRNRSQDPFTVAEISAFSNAPVDWTSDADVHLADNSKTFTTTAPPTVGVISH